VARYRGANGGIVMVLSPIFSHDLSCIISGAMSCEERERLAKIYIAAVAKNNKSARVIAGLRSNSRSPMSAPLTYLKVHYSGDDGLFESPKSLPRLPRRQAAKLGEG